MTSEPQCILCGNGPRLPGMTLCAACRQRDLDQRQTTCAVCAKTIYEGVTRIVRSDNEHLHERCATTAAPAPSPRPTHCWECGHPLDGARTCPRCGEAN